MVVLRSALMATTAVLGPVERADRARDHDRLARPDPAAAAARRRRDARAGAAPDPARRRADAARAAARARAAGFPVCPSYGLTQACSTVTVAEPGDLETAGRALPGVGVAIADDGEIVVSGGTVNALGSLRTGDLGRLDEQRPPDRHRPQGRRDHHRRRERRAGRGRGGARRAPGRRRGGRLRAPAPALGRGDHRARRAARRRRARRRRDCAPTASSGSRRFKVPKAFELVGELPRTASGKVRRADLR